MIIKKIKQILIIWLVFVGFSGLAFAQITITDSGGGTGGGLDVPFDGPTRILNVAEYGIFPLLVFITTIVLLITFLIILGYIIVLGSRMIMAEGDSGAIQDNTKAIRKIITGIAVAFSFLIFYAVLSLFFGVNIFEWGSKLAQCGSSGEFLFDAEYRAQLLDEDFIQDEILIYCCEEIKFIPEDEREQFTSVRMTDGFNSGDADAIGVGAQNGGWLLVQDVIPGNDSVYPASTSSVEGCREFSF